MKREILKKRVGSLVNRGFTKRFLVLFALLFIFAIPAFGQVADVLGVCGKLCSCINNFMINNDGVEVLPRDGDSQSEDSSEFKTVAFSGSASSEESATYAIFEAYRMTPEEIFQEEYKNLSKGKKEIVDHLFDGEKISLQEGSPIPEHLWAHLVSLGLAYGPFFNAYNDWYSYYALTLDQKTCFFKRGCWKKNKSIFRPQDGEEWVCRRNGRYDPKEPRSETFKGTSALLEFCVPTEWLHDDTKSDLERIIDQFLTYQEQPDGTGEIDFFVAMTPFLGTADLLKNQGVYKELVNGNYDRLPEVACSMSGDLFVAANGLRLMGGAARTAKVLHYAGLVAGCGSVMGTGHFLYSKDQWQAADYGKSAFLGLEVIGLLSQTKLPEILKKYRTLTAFRRKNPETLCTGCGPKCDLPNEVTVNLDKQTLPEIGLQTSALAKFKVKTSPNRLNILTSLIDDLLSPEQLKKELPATIVRRDSAPLVAIGRKGQNKAHLDKCSNTMWPANIEGINKGSSGKQKLAVTPELHVRSPQSQGSSSALISFSDPRVFPEGVDFGDQLIVFKVHEYLDDVMRGKIDNVADILTGKQLDEYFTNLIRKNVFDAFKNPVPPSSISIILNEVERLAELQVLNGGKQIPAKQLSSLIELLQNPDVVGKGNELTRNQAIFKIQQWFNLLIHRKGNAEILVLGTIPGKYIEIRNLQ